MSPTIRRFKLFKLLDWKDYDRSKCNVDEEIAYWGYLAEPVSKPNLTEAAASGLVEFQEDGLYVNAGPVTTLNGKTWDSMLDSGATVRPRIRKEDDGTWALDYFYLAHE